MSPRYPQSRPLVLALALGGALLFAPSASRGDSWTNAAGQAVEATLLSLDGERAVFKGSDGKRFTMPLASLSPASRKQALNESGRIVVPEKLRSEFGLCVKTLDRLGELRKAGELGDDAYTEQRNAALEHLKKAFQRLDVPETSRDQLLMLARTH
jgi:hypothetical protein